MSFTKTCAILAHAFAVARLEYAEELFRHLKILHTRFT